MVYANGCGSHPPCCAWENEHECLCFCGTHSSANKSILGVPQLCPVCFWLFHGPLVCPTWAIQRGCLGIIRVWAWVLGGLQGCPLFFFLLLLVSHCLRSSPFLGWVERPLCPGALSVFGGGPDSALSVGMYGGIGARSDGLTNNQSINQSMFIQSSDAWLLLGVLF